jgi:hypothetical protein
MANKRLPDLPATGRRYLRDTLRARLASPGLEKYRRPGGPAPRVALALLAFAALVATMVWLAR